MRRRNQVKPLPRRAKPTTPGAVVGVERVAHAPRGRGEEQHMLTIGDRFPSFELKAVTSIEKGGKEPARSPTNPTRESG